MFLRGQKKTVESDAVELQFIDFNYKHISLRYKQNTRYHNICFSHYRHHRHSSSCRVIFIINK
jgi:hypothetical protein